MKRQMEIVDVDDRTLLMHASCSGSSAMFNVISQEVQRKQVRLRRTFNAHDVWH